MHQFTILPYSSSPWVTVPVRGIRLHRVYCNAPYGARSSYCPREGYKVASSVVISEADAAIVTVPVRGIRLHQAGVGQLCAFLGVTVPVRGIRLHRQKCTNASP